MSDEELLVGRDVLERDDALARDALEHAVDEQERIAMRQPPHDLVDAERPVFRVVIAILRVGRSHPPLERAQPPRQLVEMPEARRTAPK